MEKLTHFKIGQIVNTQGLKGDVRVYPSTDDLDRFEELEYFYMDKDLTTKWIVESVRYKGNLAILKIKGIDNVNDAERLKGKNLYVSRENARELEEEEYFIADMVGIEVYTVNGDYVGVLSDVLQYSANDVYVINGSENQQYLIPAIMKFVPTIDMKNKKMIIDPIKGMID